MEDGGAGSYLAEALIMPSVGPGTDMEDLEGRYGVCVAQTGICSLRQEGIPFSYP